jgi:CheY-like chemotaxis protein
LGSRVLIVHDDVDLLESLVRFLGRFGYTCLTASSGTEAMAFMEVEAPDVVVTDLHMPGIDALAVTRHARGHCPPIPVVLMTAYPAPEAQQQLREAGGVVHVAKPFRNADLLNAVRRALGASGQSSSPGR